MRRDLCQPRRLREAGSRPEERHDAPHQGAVPGDPGGDGGAHEERKAHLPGRGRAGARIGLHRHEAEEAANLTWANVDLERKEITVRGDPETRTKNGEIRHVPLTPDAERLFGAMRADRREQEIHRAARYFGPNPASRRCNGRARSPGPARSTESPSRTCRPPGASGPFPSSPPQSGRRT